MSLLIMSNSAADRLIIPNLKKARRDWQSIWRRLSQNNNCKCYGCQLGLMEPDDAIKSIMADVLYQLPPRSPTIRLHQTSIIKPTTKTAPPSINSRRTPVFLATNNNNNNNNWMENADDEEINLWSHSRREMDALNELDVGCSQEESFYYPMRRSWMSTAIQTGHAADSTPAVDELGEGLLFRIKRNESTNSMEDLGKENRTLRCRRKDDDSLMTTSFESESFSFPSCMSRSDTDISVVSITSSDICNFTEGQRTPQKEWPPPDFRYVTSPKELRFTAGTTLKSSVESCEEERPVYSSSSEFICNDAATDQQKNFGRCIRGSSRLVTPNYGQNYYLPMVTPIKNASGSSSSETRMGLILEGLNEGRKRRLGRPMNEYDKTTNRTNGKMESDEQKSSMMIQFHKTSSEEFKENERESEKTAARFKFRLSSSSSSSFSSNSVFKINRNISAVRSSLQEKILKLRKEKKLVDEKIREVKEAEKIRLNQLEKFREELTQTRKTILLRTIEELKRNLNQQTQKLQQCYDVILTEQQQMIIVK